MSAIYVLSNALDDGQRGRLVYGGDILVFKDVPPLVELCVVADELIRAAFGNRDPLRAQFELDQQDYVARVESLQQRFRKHTQVGQLMGAALGHIGMDLRRACWDWLYLRALPHGDSHTHRRTAGIGFHRDTWSSNVYAQTNWWTPIYAITAERTLAFYPNYWFSPIKNTSDDWDLEEIRAQRSRNVPGKGPSTSIPVVPEPSEPVDTGAELRLVIEPGDLLCFSGAHLHASVPNHSGIARFSLEVRTVDAADVAMNRGAPNVDGHAPRVAVDWFRSIEGDTPLTQLLTAVRGPASKERSP
jgi:hypothetical protein